MSTPKVEEIRARANSVFPGPWGWFGDGKHKNIYLATNHSGRKFILGFRRWGMQAAQPEFAHVYPGEEFTRLVPAETLLQYEVCHGCNNPKDPRLYRHTIDSIKNPIAIFIEHSKSDITVLLARIDELEHDVAVLETTIGDLKMFGPDEPDEY